MIEYVNRDAIKTRLEQWQKIIKDKYGVEDDYVRCLDNAIYIVEDVPVADVVEQTHGKWLHEHLTNTSGGSYPVVRCSECMLAFQIPGTNYCPNCGARMEGKE